MYTERYTISCTTVTAVVHFGFNGYGSKTALLCREGERRPLKFHHLPADPEIGFPEPWAAGAECADNDRPRARLDVKNPPSRGTLSPSRTDTAHSRGKSFYCFVINLYGEVSETDEKRRGRERERVSKGVANSRRRRRRRRWRSRKIKRAGNDDDLSPDGLGPFHSHDVTSYIPYCGDDGEVYRYNIYCYNIRLTYVDAERQLADKTSGGYGQDDGKITNPSASHDGCAPVIRILYLLYFLPSSSSRCPGVCVLQNQKTQRSYNNNNNDIRYFIHI